MDFFKVAYNGGFYFHTGTIDSAVASCFKREFRVYDARGKLVVQVLGRIVECYEYDNTGTICGTY